MSVFDYSIQGVSGNVQFGKQGPIIGSTLTQFSLYLSDGITVAPIIVATPSLSGHAATKSYVDTATSSLIAALGVTTGTYSPNLAAHYISSATSVVMATNDLDTSLYTAITNAGLSSSGLYSANTSAHYINTAVSIVDSTNKLDTAIFNTNALLSTAELSIGLSSLGSYSAPSSNYLGTTTSVMTALTTLDTQIFTINNLNLATRVSSLETFETATTNTDTQQSTYIANINTSSGFPSTGIKGGYSSSNFILNTDSLMGAISKLDTEAQVIASSITSMNTTLSALNSNVGTPGTYYKVVTDTHGRVTSGSNLAPSDITTALGYTPIAAVSTHDVLIASTAQTSLLSVTPTSNINMIINVFYRVVTAATNVTLIINYTDNGLTAQTMVLTPITLQSIGNYCVSGFINSAASTPVTVSITAGTINQVYASVTIEQN